MTTKETQSAKPTRISGSGPNRRFKWVVEFEVDESWVADGFDLNDDRAHEMIHRYVSYSYGHEVSGKVLRAPDPKAIRKAQGYED
jgi:hypothetical protein